MKRGLSIILIFVMGLQSFYPLAIYSYYYANQGYVASVLCENKEKPQLKCKGKCFVKKQLDKTEKEENKEKKTSKGAETFVYISAALFYTEHLSYPINKGYPPFKSDKYTFLFNRHRFRPPGI